MWSIAKSAKRQVKSTESSHIVNTTIRLSRNIVQCMQIPVEYVAFTVPSGHHTDRA